MDVYFVYLAPLLCGFIRKPLVYHWHNLIEKLTITLLDVEYDWLVYRPLLVVSTIGDLLHQRRGRSPWLVIRCLSDLLRFGTFRQMWPTAGEHGLGQLLTFASISV